MIISGELPESLSYFSALSKLFSGILLIFSLLVRVCTHTLGTTEHMAWEQ